MEKDIILEIVKAIVNGSENKPYIHIFEKDLNKLLPLFSIRNDNSNWDKLSTMVVKTIVDNKDIFSLYNISVDSRGRIHYKDLIVAPLAL